MVAAHNYKLPACQFFICAAIFPKKRLTIIYDENKRTNEFDRFNARIIHQITYSFISYNKPGVR
jgi:hypothetical protein